MLTEIQYRTFDELLDSIKIDLRHYELEGMIDPQQLIKVAMKVNFDLGLKVNPSRSKAITISKGKGKLPLDFHVLNFALICEGHKATGQYGPSKTFTDSLLDALMLALDNSSNVRQYSTTVDIVTGNNTITHNLNSLDVVVQALGEDGNMQSFQLEVVNENQIRLISEATVTVPNVRVTVVGQRSTPLYDRAEIISQNGASSVVTYNTLGRRDEYHSLIPMRIDKNKSVSADCFNTNSKDWHTGVIKNGFLVTNFEEGVVYINYQSLMEDDFGNLLVMDHPMVNEYYEYALKQRVYENLFMSGENVMNYLNLVEARLRTARNNALSYINTPDFREMKQVWEMNRRAQYHNYYNMFKR